MEILRGKFMKHEYRKHEKGLYLPKTKPELITVPKQKFIMIDGKGGWCIVSYSLCNKEFS